MFGRYKEVWYGATIGISTWMLDAMMHAIQRGPISWSAFTKEAIASDSAGLLFRIFFVVVSTASGVSLWRSNRHRCELRAARSVWRFPSAGRQSHAPDSRVLAHAHTQGRLACRTRVG